MSTILNLDCAHCNIPLIPAINGLVWSCCRKVKEKGQEESGDQGGAHFNFSLVSDAFDLSLIDRSIYSGVSLTDLLILVFHWPIYLQVGIL